MPDPAALSDKARDAVQSLMRSGQFDQAYGQLEDLLATRGDEAETLYLAAVSARYLGRFDAARAHVDRLKAIEPEFGRAFQEEGHLFRDKGQPEEAVAAYRQACQHNPALEASWTAQARLLDALGRPAEAEAADAQARRLKALPAHLVAVTHHLHEGRILKAETICRVFLQKNPHHVEGMRLLADIGTRLGVTEDADFLLETAIALEPDNIQLRLDHIGVLRKRQKFADALLAALSLYERDPENPLFMSHLAIECMHIGDYERALDLFDAVLRKVPCDPATLTSRGHSLKTYGKQDEAIASYRDAVASRPDHGEAWYSLANLKTYRFSEADLLAMKAEEARPGLNHMSRLHLCFALGKALEDTGDHDAAFEYYARGNALKRQQARYTSDQMEAEFAAQKATCRPELFAGKSGAGCSAPDPIFILGLPRAGSTLLEQILASHSQVDGTLELPNILSLAHRLRGRKLSTEPNRYPDILHEMTGEELAALGEEYLSSTWIHRQGAPYFTDKMPNNFRHIGLIHLILPNAKIIDARRNPMDCCWSGFKQLFAEGQEFTYSLEDIGRYYKAYVDLMDHWERVLPMGRILRVQHEDVLDDIEGQVRRILDHCGLPFEQACIDFHETARAVRTASSEQVRQPLNRSGLEQWRPFRAHLAPLIDALGPDLAPPGE